MGEIMYNKIKTCPDCNWQIKYDENRSTFKFNEYKFCPKCATKLTEKDTCPDF